MFQTDEAAAQPSATNTEKPQPAAIGNVRLLLVLISAILTVIPWSRTVGLTLLVVLAVPAFVGWVRARKLTDGSRGLTTTTLSIGLGAFILGGALGSGSQEVPSAAAEVAPTPAVQQAAPAPVPVVVTPAPLLAPPAQPQAVPTPHAVVPEPVRTAVPAPRVVAPQRRANPAPARPTVTDEPSGTAYYKNCAAARAAGAAPIQQGEPGYRSALDRDGDGTACDK
jgi:hypothetical protein